MSAKSDLKAIEALEATRGWKVVREIMEKEIVQSAMSIADNPRMTLDEINFRRGSIFAAKALLEMPQRLLVRLENELALAPKDDKGIPTGVIVTPP